MIITILHSSRTFAGVEYNERKVSKGTGELLEMKNFSYLEQTNERNSNSMRKFLVDYSATNDRIVNTQFHVAISCKGNDQTHEELQKIAHDYLETMGYADEGQPLLIYAHHDTNNNHIHIITSRVNPKGMKINDSNERIKTQKFIQKEMGLDFKKEAQSFLSKALQYKFENSSQFKAILESSGYDCYEDDDKLFFKKGGMVNASMDLSQIEEKKQKDYLDDKRKKQLKAIMLKYRDMSANKEELDTVLNKKFGVNLIFVGKKDRPYGYMIVDHKEKSVYKGSAVLPLKDLLIFQSKKERFSNIDMTIDAMMDDSNVTTKELNQILHRQFGTRLSHGKIGKGKHKTKLPTYINNTIKWNNKLAWLQSFNPQNKDERKVITTFSHLNKDQEHLIKIDAKHSFSKIEIDNLKTKLDSVKDETRPFDAMRAIGINIFKINNRFYIVDFENKHIVDANKYGIAIKTTDWQQTNNAKQHLALNADFKKLLNQGGSSDGNREFEVGRNGRYDDVDDERRLYR